MAVVNFLFGNQTASGFNIEGAVSFEADLTIEEMHNRSATATDHPVEDGGTISDHVILEPERVRLDGFVTDAGTRGVQQGATQEAFDKLDAAWRSGQLMQVITGRKTYADMVLVSVDLPRERPSSMTFSMEFKQIRLVTPEVVEGVLSAEQVLEADRDLLQPEVDQGATRAGRARPEDREQALEDRATEIDSTLGRITERVLGEQE